MKIDRLELRLLKLPLVHFFETSFGRIDDKHFILVRVDGDGATGYGECVAELDPYYSSETNDTVWHIIADFIAPRVLGARVRAPARRLSRAQGDPRPQHGEGRASKWRRGICSRGSAASRSRRVLGGTRDRIASGVSIGIQPSLDDLVAERRARARGRLSPDQDRRSSRDGICTPVEAVRARFGAIPLMVDANAAYTLADADHLARLDAFDLMMIEQPLDYDDVADHAALQRRLKTPICLDESIKTVGIAREAIAAGACRIINIKPGRVGGFAESIRLHDLCASHGIPVWHGGMLESGIGRAANIHLSTLPNFSLPGDVAASRRYFDPDLIEPPIEVAADGTIRRPHRSRPGRHDPRRPRRPRDAEAGELDRRRGRRKAVKAGRQEGGKAEAEVR